MKSITTKKLKYFLCFGMLATPLLNAADLFAAGRISSNPDPGVRCMNKGLPAESCKRMQDRALARGCVTLEEYETLKAIGAAPSCDPDMGPGLEQLMSWCPCGCFHPDMLIQATDLSGNPMEITAREVAENRLNYRLIHLTAQATLSSFSQTSSPIRMSTRGPESRPLVVIETTDGTLLKVTEKHAIATADGRMVQATSLSPGQGLLDSQGRFVAIRSIQTEAYDGEVVNFQTDTNTSIEHVIFAQGLAVGDQAWQSTLEDELNQIRIRE